MEHHRYYKVYKAYISLTPANVIGKLLQALHIEHVQAMQIDDARRSAVRLELMPSHHLQQQAKEVQDTLLRTIGYHNQCGQHIA